jgi:hypothetical protein
MQARASAALNQQLAAHWQAQNAHAAARNQALQAELAGTRVDHRLEKLVANLNV